MFRCCFFPSCCHGRPMRVAIVRKKEGLLPCTTEPLNSTIRCCTTRIHLVSWLDVTVIVAVLCEIFWFACARVAMDWSRVGQNVVFALAEQSRPCINVDPDDVHWRYGFYTMHPYMTC